MMEGMKSKARDMREKVGDTRDAVKGKVESVKSKINNAKDKVKNKRDDFSDSYQAMEKDRKASYELHNENKTAGNRYEALTELLDNEDVVSKVSAEFGINLEEFDFKDEKAVTDLLEKSRVAQTAVNVEKNYKELYRNELKNEYGIVLTDEQFASITKYVNEGMKTKPEYLKELEGEIAEFQQRSKGLERLKDRLKDGTVKQMAERRRDLKQMKKREGRWFKSLRPDTQQDKELKEKMKTEYQLLVTDLKSEIKKSKSSIKEGKATEAEVARLQERFADLRTKLLQQVEPALEMEQVAKEAFANMLATNADGDEKQIEKLRKSAAHAGDGSIESRSGIKVSGDEALRTEAVEKYDQELIQSLAVLVENRVSKIPAGSDKISLYREALKDLFLRRELNGERGSSKTEKLKKGLKKFLESPTVASIKKGMVKMVAFEYKMDLSPEIA